MAENPPVNVQQLLHRRKQCIRLGDAAITRSAWYQYGRHLKGINNTHVTQSQPLTDHDIAQNIDFPAENSVTPTGNSETIDNTNHAELPTTAETPANFDLLTNLVIDVSTLREVRVDNNTAIASTVPNGNAIRETNTAFNELVSSPNFYRDTLNPRNITTESELVLMYLKFGLKNNLCQTGFEELSQMLNRALGQDILPQTRYMIDKTFNNIINVEYHAICYECSLYLGEMETASKLAHCPHCQVKLALMNPSSVNYFVIIDPSQSIKSLLEEFEDFYHYVVNERQSDENYIKDIFDGRCYQEFLQKLSEDERKQYVTLNINTDGAPRFESSSYSVWPIYVMPNEVPLKHRHPIVAGLWYGKHKPNMIPFLMPFTESINRFSRNGIECNIKNKKLKIKLFVICVPVDAVARAPMQGLKQFNGYNSCNWCEQEGVWEHGVRFPYEEPGAPRRNPESMLRDMEEVVNNGTCIKGIQSLSPLILFKHYNIVEGFVPDHLHASLAGVGPQLTEILVKYLTPAQICLMDQILLQIKAPHQIARLSRPFTERAQWKAREWENCLPLFTLFLQNTHPEKVEHWSYFVKSHHILLGDNIKIDRLQVAHNMLHTFVKNIKIIYKDLGHRPMTFNVHQMLHIARSVFNWGPLFVHSTFPFESRNMQVLQAIKCAKGIIQQVSRFINFQYCLGILKLRAYPLASSAIKEFVDQNQVQKTFKLTDEGPTYFGTATLIGERILENFNLSKEYTRGFLKMVKSGCIYNTSRKDNDRSCNYYAQLMDGRFIKIDLFVIDQEREEELTICNIVKTKTFLDTYNPMQLVEEITDELEIVRTQDIRTVCIFQNVNQLKYICPLPNLYHY